MFAPFLAPFGMTTSISNAAAVPALGAEAVPATTAERPTAQMERRRHTLASRLAFLFVCAAIALTTLAYGTVHSWSLGIFAASAAALVCLWAVDGFVLGSIVLPRNPLQWPLLGMIALGLVQLLPLRAVSDSGSLRSISLDPYTTRLVLIQVAALAIYFAAVIVFVDSPRRLKALVRMITIFGFVLAIFGLTQSFTGDGSRIYWFRQLTQSTAFGPFVNRHHFAGYMELAVAIPFGLLATGAVESYKRPLYAFAAVVMAMSLVATNSRGGILSLGAEIFFVIVFAGFNWRKKKKSCRAVKEFAPLRSEQRWPWRSCW